MIRAIASVDVAGRAAVVSGVRRGESSNSHRSQKLIAHQFQNAGMAIDPKNGKWERQGEQLIGPNGRIIAVIAHNVETAIRRSAALMPEPTVESVLRQACGCGGR